MVIAKCWMGEEGVNLQGTRGEGLGKGTCCISDLGGGYTTVQNYQILSKYTFKYAELYLNQKREENLDLSFGKTSKKTSKNFFCLLYFQQEVPY